MSMLFNYFAASSDEEAATVIDRIGGSRARTPGAHLAEPRETILNRNASPGPAAIGSGADDGLEAFDTVSVLGIDPVVRLGNLEDLIVGRLFDEVLDDSRRGREVMIPGGRGYLVVALTETMSSAFAAASDEALEEVSVLWSETEELWTWADPRDLAEFLKELAGLARRAKASERRLYCWVRL